MFNEGIFNLESLNIYNDDDILDSPILESNEFESSIDPGSPKDVSISVPGGLNENPSAKPADANSISVPGGLNERPSGASGIEHGISVPNKVTMTSDAYNSIIADLNKSFKEFGKVLDYLENVTVVSKTTDDIQREYAESAIDKTLLEAYENGPIFEAVGRKDKHDVKKIVKNIRGRIEDDLENDKVKFYKPHLIIRLITGVLPAVGQINATAAVRQIWTQRLWQTLGVIHMEMGNIKSVVDDLNKKYADDLGEYKVLAVKAIPALYDLFKTKLGWKNSKKSYFLLVDKKVPAEIREFQDKVKEGMSQQQETTNATDNKKDDKDDSKNDSKEITEGTVYDMEIGRFE